LFLASGFVGSGIYSGIAIWDMLTRDRSADAYWSCMTSSPQASSRSGGAVFVHWRTFAQADQACASFRPTTLSRADAERQWATLQFTYQN